MTSLKISATRLQVKGYYSSRVNKMATVKRAFIELSALDNIGIFIGK